MTLCRIKDVRRAYAIKKMKSYTNDFKQKKEFL